MYEASCSYAMSTPGNRRITLREGMSFKPCRGSRSASSGSFPGGTRRRWPTLLRTSHRSRSACGSVAERAVGAQPRRLVIGRFVECAAMKLQRLDHVSLNVADRASSIAWYREVLGLEQLNQPSEDDEPVFLGQPGLQFGLFQAQRQSPPRQRESSGLRHVAIVVDDLDAAQERLRSHGVEFRYEDHGNALSVYFDDPDGHVLEITSYVR
jgi:glyoxylase I family protein